MTLVSPNVPPIDMIDLNNDPRNFSDFDGKSDYVLFSNVYNVEDALYEQLIHEYEVARRFEDRGVFVVIYRKRRP